MSTSWREPLRPVRASAERPCTPLQRKLVIWTVVMVVVPTLLCAVWLTRIAGQTMAASHAGTVAILGQTLAASLADDVAQGWSHGAGQVLDTLAIDPRVAFVMVTDTEGAPLHRRTADPDAWVAFQHYVESHGQGRGVVGIQVDQPIVLSDSGDLVACKLPVWYEPDADGAPQASAGSRRLVGFVVLAMSDPTMPAALTSLRAMQLGAACGVCLLSIPVVVWAMRRWTAPLRSLLDATTHLAGGQMPAPVPVSTRDEVGLLAQAFNAMVRRLTAAQLRLQRANRQLEQNVAQRTAELEQATRRLESEIQDKNEFLRAVSHDLGAPLRNIEGLATMLLLKYREHLADDAQNKLERIAANVKAQTDLINDLMELSAIRTRPGQPQRIDLNELVDELRDSLCYDLERRGVSLQVVGPLPVIVAERNRMRQLFQNLFDNAVKFMLDSPVRRITVTCQAEGHDWHFTVSDTGSGIAESDVPHLFQVFHRASHRADRDVPGRGLGLAGVKSIVETHGGRIWVQSQLGQGSTFHFTLDRRLVDAAAVPAAAPAVQA